MVPSGITTSGDAEPVTDTSADPSVTTVVVLTVLSLMFPSGPSLATVAALINVPGAVGITRIATVTVSPTATVPSVQDTRVLV